MSNDIDRRNLFLAGAGLAAGMVCRPGRRGGTAPPPASRP